MSQLTSLIALIPLATLLILSIPTLIMNAAEGQQQGNTPTFQSIEDGFRVQVPDGWVVDDIDITEDFITQQMANSFGIESLVKLCPETETLPKIGGGIVCSDAAEENVFIIRHTDLQSKPEFAELARENKSITISDYLAYSLQFFEQLDFSGFKLFENIDRLVNVTDPQTNQTIATAPAKYVEMSFSNPEGEFDSRDYDLFVLSNDGNMGYALGAAVLRPSYFSQLPEELPPEQQQIFDSFELLQPPPTGSSSSSGSDRGSATSSSSNLTASSNHSSSTIQEQQQGDEEGVAQAGETGGSNNQTAETTGAANREEEVSAGAVATTPEGGALTPNHP